MLDCGEGTYGQLVRRFGVTATASLLRSLRCIFVTHMHADHHLGIIEPHCVVQAAQADEPFGVDGFACPSCEQQMKLRATAGVRGGWEGGLMFPTLNGSHPFVAFWGHAKAGI